LAVHEFLEERGVTEEQQLEFLRGVWQAQKATPELTSLKEHFQLRAEVGSQPNVLERTLVLRAVIGALERLPSLPVDDSVKHLFCREFQYYANPPESGPDNFAMTGYPFVAVCELALLNRFPSGQYQWRISGFSRRWLATIQQPSRLRLIHFLASKMHGVKPYFVTHMAVSYHRTLFVTPREHQKFFYRMALALQQQPEIKGILGVSWLHSVETHRISPHLKFENEPFLESGGIYFDLGPAPSGTDDFCKGDKSRSEAYQSGEFKPTIGGVMCSRAQALAWKDNHPEIAALLAVK
jgi:hypothetical protein